MQVIFCTDIPSQKAPPLRGAGLVQVRERFCHPLPQRTLQADHSVQEDQPPFTERKKRRKVFTDCLLCASRCARCCEFGRPGTKRRCRPTGALLLRQQEGHRYCSSWEIVWNKQNSSTDLWSTWRIQRIRRKYQHLNFYYFKCSKIKSQGSSIVEGNTFT